MRLLATLFCLAAAEDDHHGHEGHGETPYEWAGIFETPGNDFVWIAQKVDSSYADPTMKLVALPAGRADEAALNALAKEGEHSMEEDCSTLHAGETIVLRAHVCYTLHFDVQLSTSQWKVDASNTNAIAFFAQHFPIEFERDTHYFQDSNGEDVEPMSELPKEEEEQPDWAGPMISALIVNLVTFTGVLLLVPAFKRQSDAHPNDFQGVVSAFACGAMLSCALYLLLFEATHLVATGWTAEVDVLWRWGTAVLGGYSLPVFTQTVAGLLAQQPQATVVQVGVVPGNTGKGDEEDTVGKLGQGSVAVSRTRILVGVLIGDFFHNLCDGFFLGAAFKGCGAGFGWKVAAGTVAHELAQELSDFVILTGPRAQLSPMVALCLNFLSGLSVLLGAIIVMAAELDQSAVGILLAFGGGVYIHVAATECMPLVYDEKVSKTARGLCGLSFLLGAVAIGFVLLDHEHCSAGGDGHAHGH